MSIWWRQVSCWYCVAIILNFPVVEQGFCITGTGTRQRRSSTCNTKVEASVLCGSEHVSSTTAWYNQINNYCWQPTNFTSSKTFKNCPTINNPNTFHTSHKTNHQYTWRKCNNNVITLFWNACFWDTFESPHPRKPMLYGNVIFNYLITFVNVDFLISNYIKIPTTRIS